MIRYAKELWLVIQLDSKFVWLEHFHSHTQIAVDLKQISSETLWAA